MMYRYEAYWAMTYGIIATGINGFCLFISIDWAAGLEWYESKKQQVNLLLTVLKTLQGAETATRTVCFTVNDTDKSASIMYERMGQSYTLFVPYQRKYIAQMAQFKAELLRHNETSVDITQQPGIPYLVTAEELGGEGIKITNHESGEFHVFHSKEIPHYAQQIILTE
jgi:hypothetical protein